MIFDCLSFCTCFPSTVIYSALIAVPLEQPWLKCLIQEHSNDAHLNNSSVNSLPLSVKPEMLTLKSKKILWHLCLGTLCGLHSCKCLLFKWDYCCFTNALMSRPQFITMDRSISLTLFSCPANRGCLLLPSVPEKREKPWLVFNVI